MQIKNDSSFFLPKIWLYSESIYSSHLVNIFLKSISKLTLSHNYMFFYRLLNSNLLKLGLIAMLVISIIFDIGSNIQISTLPSSKLIPSNISSSPFSAELFSLKTVSLLLLFLFLINQVIKIKQNVIFSKMDLLLLFFFLLTELSTLNSINLTASFLWSMKFLRCFLVYFILSRLSLSNKEFLMISYVFLSTVVIEGIIGTGQFFSGGLLGLFVENADKVNVKEFEFNTEGINYFRIVATFFHPKNFSFYLSSNIPIIMVLLFRKNKLVNLFALVAIFISLLMILISLSRWDLVAAFLVIFLSHFLYWKLVKVNLVEFFMNRFLLVSIFLLIGFVITNPFLIKRYLNFDTTDGSLNSRVELFYQSISMFQEHPFGIGGDTFKWYLSNYDYTRTNISSHFLSVVHNLYFLIANEQGLIALLILILLLLEIIKKFVFNIHKLSQMDQIFAISYFSSLMLYFFDGLFEARNLNTSVDIIFFVMLGLFSNITNKIKRLKD